MNNPGSSIKTCSRTCNVIKKIAGHQYKSGHQFSFEKSVRPLKYLKHVLLNFQVLVLCHHVCSTPHLIHPSIKSTDSPFWKRFVSCVVCTVSYRVLSLKEGLKVVQFIANNFNVSNKLLALALVLRISSFNWRQDSIELIIFFIWIIFPQQVEIESIESVVIFLLKRKNKRPVSLMAIPKKEA